MAPFEELGLVFRTLPHLSLTTPMKRFFLAVFTVMKPSPGEVTSRESQRGLNVHLFQNTGPVPLTGPGPSPGSAAGLEGAARLAPGHWRG